ncbi:MAG TPA: PA0069 family radical SAM protein [Verrucomicrobiae bacterium]|nr:PA0069 family radical SAM protein [Verrucomicrobiae bacterium]
MQAEQVIAAHRGAPENPPNRFEKIHLEPDADWNPDDDSAPAGPPTQFFVDHSKTVIAHNDSPDIGFTSSLNPYRGCEHGCIYCYARPTHEYLGFSSGLDFESKIMVKLNAPELLREELSSPKWKPQVIVMSGVTDCYQPVESKLKLTRRCLEVLLEFRNPAGIITKNFLVARDVDVLSELAKHHCVSVCLSITTLDNHLRLVMEPRTSPPQARLNAIRKLAEANVPVSVNVAPIIPGLTDHEMPAILKAAHDAGATSAGFTVVRLPYANAPLFEKWLETHFPDRKEKVLNRIKAMRGGKLYNSQWGSRMRGEGIFAEQIEAMFDVARRKAGFKDVRNYELSTAGFRRPEGAQLSLFT